MMHRISAGALLRLATLASEAAAGDPEEIWTIVRDAEAEEPVLPQVEDGPDISTDKPAKPEGE